MKKQLLVKSISLLMLLNLTSCSDYKKVGTERFSILEFHFGEIIYSRKGEGISATYNLKSITINEKNIQLKDEIILKPNKKVAIITYDYEVFFIKVNDLDHITLWMTEEQISKLE